ncbi:MAG: ADP-dependent glucokinase/phosphofructokinase [Ancalomicrobiaceae bacterium]|nr:ADP-dependent glucokinase/phosphofructokinase [Ancalomicrobiaceae bacterium]
MSASPTPNIAIDWTRAYADLAADIRRLAANARPLVAGFAACVDKRLDLHVVAPALAETTDPAAQHFLAELLSRAKAGRGGEILVDWPEGPAFLDQFAGPDAASLGGTSAQAAWTLARIGAPVVLALGDRSAGQLSVLDPGIRLTTADGRLQAPTECTPEPGGKLAHYILEYTAGRPLPGCVPARSTRIIVRFADEAVEHDADFQAYIRGHAGQFGAGLLSSPNTVPLDQLGGVLDVLVASVSDWRTAGIDFIHWELGGFPWPGTRDLCIGRLAGHVSSIGLSLSELREVMGTDEPTDRQALRLAMQCHICRVVVHADEWALAVTRGDAERERRALMAGCLIAAARADRGLPIATPTVPRAGVFAPPPYPTAADLGDGWHMASCASPYLRHPKSCLGLGDSFTAGTLLIHAQPMADAARQTGAAATEMQMPLPAGAPGNRSPSWLQ